VFCFFSFSEIEKMFFRKAIIPTTIPCSEHVGIFLKGARKLGASQFLHVNKSVGVDVPREWYLGERMRPIATRITDNLSSVLGMSIIPLYLLIHQCR
jgi:hypothetical protein